MKSFYTLMLMLCLMCSAVFAGQPVNINTANAESLAQSLDGIGLSKAQAIVSYRQKNGVFKHADELVNIKGIGLKTIEKNRDYIQLSDSKKKS